MAKLEYHTALQVMKTIGDYTSADFDTLGITPEAFKLTAENNIWMLPHRPVVEKTLEALLFGTTDLLGIGRIQIPAEMVAAVISFYVAPANRRTACRWLKERRMAGAPADDLAAGRTVDDVSEPQLFALVLQLCSHEPTQQARQNWAMRIDERVREAAGINNVGTVSAKGGTVKKSK